MSCGFILHVECVHADVNVLVLHVNTPLMSKSLWIKINYLKSCHISRVVFILDNNKVSYLNVLFLN